METYSTVLWLQKTCRVDASGIVRDFLWSFGVVTLSMEREEGFKIG